MSVIDLNAYRRQREEDEAIRLSPLGASLIGLQLVHDGHITHEKYLAACRENDLPILDAAKLRKLAAEATDPRARQVLLNAARNMSE